MNVVQLAIDECGWRTTIQDLGRVGSERLGVPRGGAADQSAARIANILVGNPQDYPLIESLGGAIAFTASADVLVSVTGSIKTVTIGGCAVEQGQPLAVPAGACVRVECGDHAARTYVAIGGLLRTRRFLGSAAPDPRMGFTQAVLPGSRLDLDTQISRIEQPYLGRTLFRLPIPARPFDERDWIIEIIDCAETTGIPGIRELLASSTYVVDSRSDHVGIRLDGPVLHPSDEQEIVSHGVPVGAIEIPHSDELIVLGRYRTITAGYPVVGFATRQAQDLMGQVRPGREVRFAWVDRALARERGVRFELELAVLEAAALSAFASLELPVGRLPEVAPAGRN